MCFPADKRCEKNPEREETERMKDRHLESQEINTGTDRVETRVVSSTDSASYRHAVALCEPVFRLKMKFSKGFHSLEIMFQPRDSGA